MSGYDDLQFCDTHGMFHSMDARDPDCEFEDGMGNSIDPEVNDYE